MAASVVGLSEEILADVERGTSVTIVRGDSGCLIVHPAGPDAVLAARTGPHPNVGLVGLELPAVVAAVSRSLERC
jgi:predicted regulator of Ras-like GTPase activity (Roadblock/LC7/MglB family)